MGVSADRLDRARTLAKDVAGFVASYGFSAYRFTMYRRSDDGELVPATTRDEFRQYLESLYRETADMFNQWQSIVTTEVLDAILLSTVGRLPPLQIRQYSHSTAFHAVGSWLRRCDDVSFVKQLSDPRPSLWGAKQWIQFARVSGFPIEEVYRRIDEEWAMARNSPGFERTISAPLPPSEWQKVLGGISATEWQNKIHSGEIRKAPGGTTKRVALYLDCLDEHLRTNDTVLNGIGSRVKSKRNSH